MAPKTMEKPENTILLQARRRKFRESTFRWPPCLHFEFISSRAESPLAPAPASRLSRWQPQQLRGCQSDRGSSIWVSGTQVRFLTSNCWSQMLTVFVETASFWRNLGPGLAPQGIFHCSLPSINFQRTIHNFSQLLTHLNRSLDCQDRDKMRVRCFLPGNVYASFGGKVLHCIWWGLCLKERDPQRPFLAFSPCLQRLTLWIRIPTALYTQGNKQPSLSLSLSFSLSLSLSRSSFFVAQVVSANLFQRDEKHLTKLTWLPIKVSDFQENCSVHAFPFL